MNRRRNPSQQGVALVEFALVLPLLLVMTCVTTEFGRAYYQYDTLTKSVREAARYLSVRAPGVDVDKARNIVVFGNPDGTGDPMAPGLSLANVPTPSWGTAGSYPALNTVTVSVTGFTFVPLAGNVFGMSLNNIVFGTIQATMRSPS
jgi:Flp pilus assembly protein TadG